MTTWAHTGDSAWKKKKQISIIYFLISGLSSTKLHLHQGQAQEGSISVLKLQAVPHPQRPWKTPVQNPLLLASPAHAWKVQMLSL